MSPSTTDIGALTPDQKRALLRDMIAARPPVAEPVADTVPVVDVLPGAPLSYSQRRLWILHQLSPLSAAFNVAVVSPINGFFDVDAMRRALGGVVARHEVLRTRFVEHGGEPRQVVDAPAEFDLPLVDLSLAAGTAALAEMQSLLTAEARRPFDLASGPVIRATVIRLGPFQHVLACYLHHIAVDGWSMGVFGRELTALYTGFATGQAVDLPELTLQYSDFARWQHEWLTGDRLDAQLSFWREQLRDVPTLELPTDRPRPAQQRDDGACHDFVIPPDLSERIRRLCATERCTPFITTLAAFGTVLSRWSGERDLPIGTYVANRRRPELEGLIGFFLNSVVLRLRTDAGTTFRELLAQVRETALGAYDHQDVPFELIVDTLQPRRDPSRSPLIQVVFQVNNAPTGDRETPPDAMFDAKRATSIYDIAVVLFDTPGGIGGQIEYRTALFDAETIAALADRFRHVLAAAVADPDVEIDRLPLEPPEVTFEAWDTVNTTGVRHDWDVGLVEMFAAQVERHGDSVALIGDDGPVTYAALAGRASAIADRLTSTAVGRGDVVGVVVPRSPDAVAAILGVVMSGAAWLPIDVDQPRARAAAMLAQADAVAVVHGIDELIDTDATVIDLATLPSPIGAAHTMIPPPVNAASDRAYLLFTSGSTGQPKGVAAPHGQILNRLHWMWREYPWRPGEVAALTTSIGFVDSVWEIFGGLLQGVPTLVVPQDGVADLDALVERLGRHGVTRLWLVPSLLRGLLDHVDDLSARLPRLDMWVSSGETLPVELYERFRRAMPDAKLFNLYGTSEVWDATWCNPATVDLGSGRVPIGDPIDNVRVYVIDELDQLVPDGVPGELVVAGAGLTFGYLGGVDRERFEPLTLDPDRPPVRVFRSGDRAIRRRDGAIELLGRRDAQIKIRGVRVELDEVEAATASHPAVGAVAARLVTDGEPHVVAWYEALDPATDVRDIREHVAAQLPSAMVPTRFVACDALPRTSSGKVDRTALPDILPLERTGGAPPDGPTEEALAAIWREVLGISALGRDDDFFADLGGHSLLATRAMSRTRVAFARELALPLLFEHPTVRTLAAAIEVAASTSTPIVATSTIPRLDREAFRRRTPAPAT